MINYTKRELNLLALLIALIILIISNLLITTINNLESINFYYKQFYSKTIPISKTNNIIATQNFNLSQISYTSNDNFADYITQIQKEQPQSQTSSQVSNQTEDIQNIEEQTTTQREVINKNKSNKWRIQIPKINLDVHIMEGTSSETLLKAVGHFEETSKWKGNVGLAAHNRGYNCNFFEKIKNLKNGDEIIYYTSNGKKVYKVQTNKVITDTDWSYLQQTQDNRITLITCEENRKNYRRCIQAIEISNYKI